MLNTQVNNDFFSYIRSFLVRKKQLNKVVYPFSNVPQKRRKRMEKKSIVLAISQTTQWQREED